MISVEHQANSIFRIKELIAEREKRIDEESRKRAEKTQQMIDASRSFFQDNPEIDEVTAIKVLPQRNIIKIDRRFEEILSDRGVIWDGSEEWLLDFLKELTGKPVRTFLSGWKGSGKYPNAHFDLGNKIPGRALNRELQHYTRDTSKQKFPVIYYTFVRKNE